MSARFAEFSNLGFVALSKSRFAEVVAAFQRAAAALSANMSPRLVAEIHITRGCCQKALGPQREGGAYPIAEPQ